LRAIYTALENFDEQLVAITPRPVTREELLRVHTPEYVDGIASTDGESVFLDLDTQTSPGSYRAALLAAGGLCAALRSVVEGETSSAFALVRPPGHHAEASAAMGFCLFNNVAVAAAFALARLGLARVLIVDWDLHHGNGTQHTFQRRCDVLYFSTHQYPYYPGTGAFEERGEGEGEGYTINVPLMPGYVDEDFVQILQDVLVPVAEQFQPELVLVSAGFDTHRADPLGGMGVTELGYAAMTRILMDLSDRICHGRLVLALEGGYDVQALADSVTAVLRELCDSTQTRIAKRGAAGPLVTRVREVHRRYWTALA
jgi:acetoin utilization deacetylase AcuC-like enzyme